MGGHRTFKIWLYGQKFKQRWGHRTKFYNASEAKGGTPNMFKLEWGHRTAFKHVLEAEEGHFQTNPSGGRVGSAGSGRF